MTEDLASRLESLADNLEEVAVENAVSAADSESWPYACEAMAMAANAMTVATALRARASVVARAAALQGGNSSHSHVDNETPETLREPGC